MNRRQFLYSSPVFLLFMSQTHRVFSNAPHGRRATGTGFVYDPIYLEHWLQPGHPESPQRLKSIMVAMDHSGLGGKVKMLRPVSDVLPYIHLVHTEAHVDSIKAHYGHSHDIAMAAVGGALAAVEAVNGDIVRNVFCAVRPPGHHARNTGREEGFCLYNTVAVAARYAQKVMHLPKVLIIDWDYHHGNGTEEFFYADPTVLYFSTHDFHAYPGTGNPARTGAGAGVGYNINVHLECGTGDDDFVRIFEDQLLPAARRFKPDIILISAGFDSRKDDLLGCFALTDEGYVRLTRMIMQVADECCAGRIVSVLEGGYNVEGLASAVVHHVRTLLEIA